MAASEKSLSVRLRASTSLSVAESVSQSIAIQNRSALNSKCRESISARNSEASKRACLWLSHFSEHCHPRIDQLNSERLELVDCWICVSKHWSPRVNQRRNHDHQLVYRWPVSQSIAIQESIMLNWKHLRLSISWICQSIAIQESVSAWRSLSLSVGLNSTKHCYSRIDQCRNRKRLSIAAYFLKALLSTRINQRGSKHLQKLIYRRICISRIVQESIGAELECRAYLMAENCIQKHQSRINSKKHLLVQPISAKHLSKNRSSVERLSAYLSQNSCFQRPKASAKYYIQEWSVQRTKHLARRWRSLFLRALHPRINQRWNRSCPLACP